MALQVRYRLSRKIEDLSGKKPVTGQVVQDRYYVRTPQVIFMKEKITRSYDPGVDTTHLFTATSTVTTAYDRVKRSYRKMMKSDNGLPAEGIVAQHPNPNDMEDLTRVESVVGYSASADLYWLIKSGTVLQKRENVDGHSCWGIAYDTVPDVQRHVIWVDPDIGFCPRRVDLILQKQLRIRRTMSDYRDIGCGVWFPREVVFETFSKTGSLQLKDRVRVDDAEIAPIDSKTKLGIEFPPGTVIDGG